MSDLLWLFVFLQMALGGFDALYHHELTERLAWRPAQAAKLRLHMALGWSEPHGVVALALIAVLIGEAVITVWGLRRGGSHAQAAGVEPAALGSALTGRHAVLVIGGTGFIGRRVVAALVAAGHDVAVLTRAHRAAADLAAPLRVVTSLDQLADDASIDAIVNLAGEPIADGLCTARKRDRILRSRLEMTASVVALIRRLRMQPAVLVNGSAIGWYGLRGDEVLAETADGRDCFSHVICLRWEGAALVSRRAPAHRPGAGGRGRSAVATAPTPVDNAAFTAALGRALARPAILPLPAAPLRLALGALADELLLGGQRVIPRAALESGFRFLYPAIDEALGAVVGRGSVRPAAPPSPAPEASSPAG